MTTLGKVLIYVLSAGSLAALGICLWLYIDYMPAKDRQAKIEGLKNEINLQINAQHAEAELLQILVAKLKTGMWPAETIRVEKEDVPFQLAPRVQVPAKELREELERDKADIDKRKQAIATLQADAVRRLEQLREERGKTELAYAEQRQLREAIDAPKLNGDSQPAFHVLIKQAQDEKQAAETAQKALKPSLINALSELSVLQQRNEQLGRRLGELKSATSSTAVGR